MTDTPDLVEQRAIRAQAAVWVTDLHGPERSAALEEGLRRWLAEDPRHAQAFELATEAWQSSGNLPAHLSDEPRPVGPLRARRRTSPAFAHVPASIAGATLLALVLAASFYWLKDPSLATGSAEQRTVDLADGTQVTLNANSRLRVEFTDQVRQVTLVQGEALFNVTKHQSRPFVVIVDTRKIVALGTSFEVRREDARGPSFAVTLIEGRVAIEPLNAPNLIPIAPPEAIKLLSPGQRLRISAHVPDTLDTPPLEKITAWQRGQLMFDDTSIRDAAKEFNRYGKRRLSIDASVPDTIRVGGVFRIGDPDSFAHAMANAHQLRILENPVEIKLTAP
jgi:transmembrane sensor